MKTVASKIDNELHQQLVKRCEGQGCSPSEYLRSLVQKDLGKYPAASKQESQSQSFGDGGTSVKNIRELRE